MQHLSNCAPGTFPYHRRVTSRDALVVNENGNDVRTATQTGLPQTVVYPFFLAFAQLSRSVTDRLKTSLPGAES